MTRAEGSWRFLPISEIFPSKVYFIISENPSKEEESYCKQRGINSYIGKPFNKSEVLRKLKYIIQKKQA